MNAVLLIGTPLVLTACAVLMADAHSVPGLLLAGATGCVSALLAIVFDGRM